MAETGTEYRRLPGRLRGIGYGASLWLGPDHLLLARSRMFREEYKRFYLRDVQAIVTAQQPRFQVSLRAFLLGVIWCFAWIFVPIGPVGFGAIWGIAGLVLAITWLVLALGFGCTCRIYTAVSNEELPSLCRIWKARKFLDAVRPRIEEAQGGVPENWIEAVEGLQAGPAAPAFAQPAGPGEAAIEAAGLPAGEPRSMASDIFIGALLAGSVLDLLTLHSVTTPVRVAGIALSVVGIVSAIVVLIQCSRRQLRPWLRKLVIAAVALMGLEYYAATLVTQISSPGQPAPMVSNATLMAPPFVVLRSISSGLSASLGIIGVVLLLRSRSDVG